jgi:hypothetical protein
MLVVAGFWILVVLCLMLVGAVSGFPRELLQPSPATQPTAALAPQTDTAAQPVEVTEEPSVQQEAGPTLAVTPPEDAAVDAQERANEEEARRERLMVEWLGRSWPLLLLAMVLLIAASTWLCGGQVGYLGKLVAAGEAAVSEFWVVGRRAFMPLLLSGLLMIPLTILLVLVFVLTIGLTSALSGAAPGVIAGLLGFLFMVAVRAGILWLGIHLVFWAVAIVMDRAGPIAGLKASIRAVRGRWWRVFGLVVLMGLIAYGVGLSFALVEWAGSRIGGVAGAVLGVVAYLLSLVIVQLYVGFASIAAFIRCYEDIKMSSVTTASA